MQQFQVPTTAEIEAIEIKARELRAEAFRDMMVSLRTRIANLLHIGGVAHQS